MPTRDMDDVFKPEHITGKDRLELEPDVTFAAAAGQIVVDGEAVGAGGGFGPEEDDLEGDQPTLHFHASEDTLDGFSKIDFLRTAADGVSAPPDIANIGYVQFNAINSEDEEYMGAEIRAEAFPDTEGFLGVVGVADLNLYSRRHITIDADGDVAINGAKMYLANHNFGQVELIFSDLTSFDRAYTLVDGDGVLSLRVPVPASATAAGKPGMWASDASFLYTCHATNTWRRVAVAAW